MQSLTSVAYGLVEQDNVQFHEFKLHSRLISQSSKSLLEDRLPQRARPHPVQQSSKFTFPGRGAGWGPTALAVCSSHALILRNRMMLHHHSLTTPKEPQLTISLFYLFLASCLFPHQKGIGSFGSCTKEHLQDYSVIQGGNQSQGPGAPIGTSASAFPVKSICPPSTHCLSLKWVILT